MYNNGDQMVSVLKFLFAKCCQYVYTGGVVYGKISDVLNEIPTLVVDIAHHSHISTNFPHFKTDYLL